MLSIAVSAFSFFLSIFFLIRRELSPLNALKNLTFYSAHFPNHSFSLTAGKGQGTLPIVWSL